MCLVFSAVAPVFTDSEGCGTLRPRDSWHRCENTPVNCETNVWWFKEFQGQTGISLETLSRRVDTGPEIQSCPTDDG